MPSSALEESSKRQRPRSASRRSGRSLFTQVCHVDILRAAFNQVGRNRGSKGGVDDVSVAVFKAELESHLDSISKRLRGGRYVFLAITSGCHSQEE